MLAARIGPGDLLALRAALLRGERAHRAIEDFLDAVDLEHLDFGTIRLLPLIARNAEVAEVTSQPALLAKLQSIARLGWLTSQFEVSTALKDAAVLVDGGVELLATKGLAVLGATGIDLVLRPMDDVDLVVHRSDAARALALLAGQGYAPADWIAATPMWQRTGAAWFLAHFHSLDLVGATGAKIDLHWHPVSSAPSPDVTDWLWQGSTAGEVVGLACRLENPADLVVHVIAHASFDRDVGLRWAADVVEVMRSTTGGVDPDRLVATARRCAVSHVVADALALLRSAVDLDVTDDVLRALRRPSVAERATAAIAPARHVVARHRPALASAWRRPSRGIELVAAHLTERSSTR